MTCSSLNVVPILHHHSFTLLVLSAWNVLSSCLNLPTSFLLAKLQDVTPILPLLISLLMPCPPQAQSTGEFLSGVKPLLGAGGGESLLSLQRACDVSMRTQIQTPSTHKKSQAWYPVLVILTIGRWGSEGPWNQ